MTSRKKRKDRSAGVMNSGGPQGALNFLRYSNDLQNTLVPKRFGGSSAPTFTRATIATGQDFEGLNKRVVSKEPRFLGARRVENLIFASENMTNGAYSDTNNAVSTATETTFDATANGGVSQSVTITNDGSGALGRTFVYSVFVKLISGTIAADGNVSLRITGNAVTAAGLDIGTELSTTSQRFTLTASTDAAGTTVIPEVECDVAAVLEITKWSLNEVTGQTNQIVPEYRKSGIETGPEINTDANASSISNETNATTGWGVGSGGLLTSVTETDGDSLYSLNMNANNSDNGRILLDIDTRYGLTDGQDYTLVMRYRKVSGNNSQIHLAAINNGTDNAVVATVSNTSYATVTHPFTHSSTTRYLILKENGSSNNAVSRISTLSITKDAFGDQADSVQYFNTLNANVVS